MKRSTIVWLVIITVLVAARAGDLIDIKINYDFYRSEERSHSQQVATEENPPRALSAEEKSHEKSWQHATVGHARVCYVENWDCPWTRWIPLVKIGEFKVGRDYFVTVAGRVVASGHDEAKISFSIYGIMSARTFTARVMADDRKRFLADMEKGARGAPPPAPTPARPGGGPSLTLAKDRAGEAARLLPD